MATHQNKAKNQFSIKTSHSPRHSHKTSSNHRQSSSKEKSSQLSSNWTSKISHQIFKIITQEKCTRRELMWVFSQEKRNQEKTRKNQNKNHLELASKKKKTIPGKPENSSQSTKQKGNKTIFSFFAERRVTPSGHSVPGSSGPGRAGPSSGPRPEIPRSAGTRGSGERRWEPSAQLDLLHQWLPCCGG